MWHVSRVGSVGRDGVISVDGAYPVSGVSPGLLSQLDTDGRLFIGGHKSSEASVAQEFRIWSKSNFDCLSVVLLDKSEKVFILYEVAIVRHQ